MLFLDRLNIEIDMLCVLVVAWKVWVCLLVMLIRLNCSELGVWVFLGRVGGMCIYVVVFSRLVIRLWLWCLLWIWCVIWGNCGWIMVVDRFCICML